MIDTAFLKLGLDHYPAARETVDVFEKNLIELMLAAFDTKQSWSNFQMSRDESGQLQTGQSTGPTDRYVSTFLMGSVKRKGLSEKAWLSMGVYWNPQALRNTQVVACVWCSVDRGVPVPLVDLPDRDPRITLGPLNRRSERRLVMPLNGADFDPVDTFASLLDAVDAALAS